MIKQSIDFNGNNPYTLSFGKQPYQSIPRFAEINEVLEAFLNEPATQQAYMITGWALSVSGLRNEKAILVA